MGKPDAPLKVEIPRPEHDQPVWSRVGIIGVAGFVIGIAWPRVAGVRVGPSVPGDTRTTTEASAAPSAPKARPSAAASAASSATPSAQASAEPRADNKELVVVGPGKTTKCYDKKDKKLEDCGKFDFDSVATKKLKELSKCPAALGLEGKMNLSFDIHFDKKEVQVQKTKKGTTLPSSTVQGVLACAGKEFASVALEEVPHKHKHYTVVYGLTFYPPGKHPDQKEGAEGADDEKGEKAEGAGEAASGMATVSWDTALVRKDPKDGEIVMRLVRGTRVKIVGKQTDWYRIESSGKTGWVYRGAVGL